MQHPHVVRVLVLSLALLLTATIGVGVDSAFATCNGGNVCSCGSTVDVNTTLNEAVDPVCSTSTTDTCAGNGLTVNAGVTLNLGGCTLRGVTTGSSTGVSVLSGGRVSGGKIIGFGQGVFVSGTGGTVSNLQVSDSPGFGILAIGDGNTVEKSVVRRHASHCVGVGGSGNSVSNVQALDCEIDGVQIQGSANTVRNTKAHRNGGSGIAFFGNGNTAEVNRAEDNRGHGLFGNGDDLVFLRNISSRNGFCGLIIEQLSSTNATIDRNQVKGTTGFGVGLCVQGVGHTITNNVASGNDIDGIRVQSGSGHVLGRNRSTSNGRFGIADTTTGGGTAGTANTYEANICSANDLGDSSPAGLCR